MQLCDSVLLHVCDQPFGPSGSPREVAVAADV